MFLAVGITIVLAIIGHFLYQIDRHKRNARRYVAHSVDWLLPDAETMRELSLVGVLTHDPLEDPECRHGFEIEQAERYLQWVDCPICCQSELFPAYDYRCGLGRGERLLVCCWRCQAVVGEVRLPDRASKASRQAARESLAG